MNSKVDIQGDVGVAINQNHGAITVNNYYGDKVAHILSPELRKSISELLTICDACGQRKLIEKISVQLFGVKEFKSLTNEQVRCLIDIAKDNADVISTALHAQKNIEVIDEDKFYKEYGMRASEPARVALQLLLKENLIKATVARAWNNGQLNYEDNNRLTVKVNRRHLWTGNILFGLGALASIPAFFTNPIFDLMGAPPDAHVADRVTLVVLSMTICFSFVLVAMGYLKPYYASERISKYIKKINTQLRKQLR